MTGTIIYFLVDLNSGFEQFCYFILALFACFYWGESFVVTISSVVPNFLMTIIFAVAIQVIWSSNSSAYLFYFPVDILLIQKPQKWYGL